jgi:hypothetical protein
MLQSSGTPMDEDVPSPCQNQPSESSAKLTPKRLLEIPNDLKSMLSGLKYFESVLSLVHNHDLLRTIKQPQELALVLDSGHSGFALDLYYKILKEKLVYLKVLKESIERLEGFKSTKFRLLSQHLSNLPLLCKLFYQIKLLKISSNFIAMKDMARDRVQSQLEFIVGQIHSVISTLLSHHLPYYHQYSRIYQGTAKELLKEGLFKLALEKIVL